MKAVVHSQISKHTEWMQIMYCGVLWYSIGSVCAAVMLISNLISYLWKHKEKHGSMSYFPVFYVNMKQWADGFPCHSLSCTLVM